MVYEIDEEKLIEDMRIINKYIKIIESKSLPKKKDNELYLDEEFTYLGVSMAMFTIQNKLIELCEQIVDSFDKGYVPQSYSELPKILVEEKFISQEQAKILRSLFSYRNEIAHEYDDISSPEIIWCVTQLPFIKDFLKLVKKLLIDN